MNVIAHACAVAGWIVIAKYRDGRSVRGDGLQDERDQVRFGIVTFTACCRCASSIEVAKGGITKAVGPMMPKHRSLDGELGFPVGVRRRRRIGLGDGLLLRLPIDRRRRRQHHQLHPRFIHGIQETQACNNVVAIIAFRSRHFYQTAFRGGKQNSKLLNVRVVAPRSKQARNKFGVMHRKFHPRSLRFYSIP